jgi:class 3 adenylate cyclase
VWGDTVNVASRLQSTGVAGRIHVAESTRRHLSNAWQFEERAPIDIKGIGFTTTYLVR